ncbi:F pilus assembly [Escherichia coli]|nr:F pilus assembly [Escherichia coli]
MMKKNHITRTIIASAVLFSFNAAAATSYFEARNDAMGGTGVASSHYGVAPLANPALLTKHNSNDDFSLFCRLLGHKLLILMMYQIKLMMLKMTGICLTVL